MFYLDFNVFTWLVLYLNLWFPYNIITLLCKLISFAPSPRIFSPPYMVFFCGQFPLYLNKITYQFICILLYNKLVSAYAMCIFCMDEMYFT